nr:Dbuz\CG17836-PD [Drosophila buzzatii]AAX33657.1 Dbuz\CG17836-PC [Drosophila buzzatii]
MDQCNLDFDSNYSDNINSDLTAMDGFEIQQLDNAEEAEDMASICNGIDFGSDPNSDLDLGNILNSDPMLPAVSQVSFEWSSSQTKYFNELPIPADENSMENYFCSQQSLGFGVGQLDSNNEDVCTAVAVHDAPSTLCVGVKRTASAASLISAVETMPQKRSKLLLNINKSQITHPDVINTPDIIEQVLKLCEINPASNISNQNQIYEELRSAEDSTTFTQLPDFSAPGTPNSTYSISTSSSYAPTCQTGFAGLITAPVSPAISTASTSAFSATALANGSTKRKRGRPAKEHADGPDPELMSKMTENEVKAYRDRLKNNEASRVSRRKTRKREEEEKHVEEVLQARNNELKHKLQQLQLRVQRFQNYLNINFHNNSTYVKPEPAS